jgi:hypothetical protein
LLYELICLLELVPELLDLSLHHLFGGAREELSVLHLGHLVLQLEDLSSKLLLDVGGHAQLRLRHHYLVP